MANLDAVVRRARAVLAATSPTNAERLDPSTPNDKGGMASADR